MKQKRDMNEVDWNSLYASWSVTSSVWGLPFDAGVAFTEVLVPSPTDGLQIGEGIIDWWPTRDLARRRASLARDGQAGVYWNTRKGTLHTAELLYDCRGQPEAQAAVLVAASLWDKQADLPEAWRGQVYRLIDETLRITLYSPDGPFKQRELVGWHHAMRGALPVSLVDFDFAQCFLPRTPRDLVIFALIEAVLSTTLWTPVRVSHDSKGVRQV